MGLAGDGADQGPGRIYIWRQAMSQTSVLFFISLAVGVAVIGLISFETYKRRRQELAISSLQAIADLKVGQIVQWHRVYRDQGEALARSPATCRWLADFLRKPGDEERKREILAWMKGLKELYDFEDVLLVNAEGAPVLALDPARGQLGSFGKESIAAAIRTEKVFLSDLHRVPHLPDIHIDSYVPIVGERGTADAPAQVTGVLMFRISPYRNLYPLLQAWPVTTSTAESFLVRREGDDVLVLSALRQHRDAALNLRCPLSTPSMPAALAVLGMEGFIQGEDFFKRPVLAVMRPVPETPWSLVANIDLDEVMADVHLAGIMLLISCVSLVVLLGWPFGLVWYRKAKILARDRERAEIERQALTRHYINLSKYANDIILLADGNRRIIQANERALASYQHTREVILTMRLGDFLPIDRRAVMETMIRRTEREHSVVFETQHQRCDGSVFPVEISLRRIDESGLNHFQAIVRDTTERTQATRALEASEENLRQVVDLLPHAIYARDKTGRMILANRRFAELVGSTREALLAGAEECRAGGEDQAAARRRDDSTVIETGASRMIPEEKWVDSEGVSRILQTIRVPFTPAGHGERAVLCVSIDITENKRLQEQLAKAQKMEGIGRLAGGIAHDFNNLLQVIIGFNDILMGRMDEGHAGRRDAMEVDRAAKRASGLTRQLLAYSCKQTLISKVVDLNVIVEMACTALTRQHGVKIELVKRLDPALPPVSVDADQIEQVLVSLASNARDAMPAGGRITIQTKPFTASASDALQIGDARIGPYICLSVSDTGSGMSRASLDHLFEPFFTTKGQGNGTGLGLAMVHGIVKQHDGWIQVYSQQGMGTTIKVFLPVADQTDGGEPLAGNDAGRAPVRACRILVVEDDDLVRQFSIRILREQGHEVFNARTGRDAMVLFEEQRGRFHAVFSDVVLPDINGLDLVREMRRKKADIRLLLTSGYMDEQSRWPEIRREGIRFIQKPYPARELLAMLQSVLNEEPAEV